MAANPPKYLSDFSKIRNFPKTAKEHPLSKKLLQCIEQAQQSDPKTWPQKKKATKVKRNRNSYILRMLLKVKAAQHGVASRIIAHPSELEEIARGSSHDQILSLQGWRYDIFGKDALALKNGEISLGFKDGTITVFKVTEDTQITCCEQFESAATADNETTQAENKSKTSPVYPVDLAP